jgi:lipoprotein-anchoring transpeptidase ErfK/SrfK
MNVHVGDDSRQLIVSTTGVVIHATNVSTGTRTTHGMGQMSDDSIQHLFQRVSRPATGQAVQGTQQENPSWQEKYGKGHNIS